ncbi:MAG: hypothetical protein ACRCZC_06610 [Culicoidibacterales bacterium]
MVFIILLTLVYSNVSSIIKTANELEELTRVSEIYKQLSNRVRLQMLLHLRMGPVCVSELWKSAGLVVSI